ncbi:mechanosensitive ion channel family protein [Halomicroarcula sp. F13]|uniref:Mechanosensitive ion channel family protein n=1 Tax=Haloarcula rubra TaxID=2487747 RepID=A0AAW4PS44_9EURY|nr:mechanosensitive ion channel family protein [Halomicroarcula rubra]MBX0324006.1 mechanosensitive ion channel family protein [Halomicroarcula rubra]
MQATDTTTATADRSSQTLLDLVQALQESLEALASSEGQLVATAILLGVLVLGVVVLPALLGRLRSLAVDQLDSGWLTRLARYTPTSFRGILLRTAQLTLLLLVVVSFLVVWDLVDVVGTLRPYVESDDPTLLRTLQTVLLTALAFVLSDQLQRTIDRLSLALDDFTEHQEEILLRLGQVTIFVTAGATILAIWGINIGGLLVGAGFLGIVVGFAARQTLGSLIAGFVLMFSRPFTIGDWVVVGDQEGIVTNITIFNTRLENFDGEFVIIPNDQVSNEAITNRSQKGLLRLTLDVGIDYDADVEAAMDTAEAAMARVGDIVDSPPPQVIPKSFGDSAIVLELRFWIDHPTPPRKWRAISAVVQEIKTAFDEEDISIPFPQRTLKTRGEGQFEETVRSVGPEAED